MVLVLMSRGEYEGLVLLSESRGGNESEEAVGSLGDDLGDEHGAVVPSETQGMSKRAIENPPGGDDECLSFFDEVGSAEMGCDEDD